MTYLLPNLLKFLYLCDLRGLYDNLIYLLYPLHPQKSQWPEVDQFKGP